MVHWLERSQGKVVGIRLEGKITGEDYEYLLPRIESILDEFGAVRILVVIDEVTGVALKALWEDLKFDVKHFRAVERLALAGEGEWQEFSVVLSKPFVNGEARFFHHEEEENAWEWIFE